MKFWGLAFFTQESKPLLHEWEKVSLYIIVFCASGIKVLGTFITEWDEGRAICNVLLSTKESAQLYAELLTELAVALGFDGWLVCSMKSSVFINLAFSLLSFKFLSWLVLNILTVCDYSHDFYCYICTLLSLILSYLVEFVFFLWIFLFKYFIVCGTWAPFA